MSWTPDWRIHINTHCIYLNTSNINIKKLYTVNTQNILVYVFHAPITAPVQHRICPRKQLWELNVLPANLMNAPAIYQGSVFASDTTGGIRAVSMQSGKPVWFTNTSKSICQDNGALVFLECFVFFYEQCGEMIHFHFLTCFVLETCIFNEVCCTTAVLVEWWMFGRCQQGSLSMCFPPGWLRLLLFLGSPTFRIADNPVVIPRNRNSLADGQSCAARH